MDTERAVRKAVEKTGTEHHINDKDKKFRDHLAEAADQIGSKTGRRDKAESFIENAMKVVDKSNQEVIKLRRPDLFPKGEKPVTRRRTFFFGK